MNVKETYLDIVKRANMAASNEVEKKTEEDLVRAMKEYSKLQANKGQSGVADSALQEAKEAEQVLALAKLKKSETKQK